MGPTHREGSTPCAYFSDMDFARSTQNKSWLFDDESLKLCRSLAVSGQERNIRSLACKFASGFHRRYSNREENTRYAEPVSSISFSVHEQETLVRFHAHQIQALVGPSALLSDLRTSEAVVSTAVIFLRRFYLSNFTLNICPRMMTAASCLLAAKIEEDKIDIDTLSHATEAVQLKVKSSPLCSEELRRVSVEEIEEGERLLMEGLNYELHCFHAHESVRKLAPDMADFLEDIRAENAGKIRSTSPVGVADEEHSETLASTACDIVRRATVFSDLPFLFPPSLIAFAAVTVASGSLRQRTEMGDDIEAYLMDRFPGKTGSEVVAFADNVNDIIQRLVSCPWMDLFRSPEENRKLVSERARELRGALRKTSYFRCQRAYQKCQRNRAQKRMHASRCLTRENIPAYKMARITPIDSISYKSTFCNR